MVDGRLGANLATLSSLAEPLRRALYEYVASQDASVSRDGAAAALGVARSAAAFHLDRLVEAGLLEVEFRRLSGRAGPGAGRPAKLYRRAEREVAVALPPRQYDLAADLFAAGVSRSARTGERAGAAVEATARDRGRSLGEMAGAGAGEAEPQAVAVLAAHGFEPRPCEGGILLANCPFHRLIADHRDLVCGMNLALVAGMLEGLRADDLEAVADTSTGRCCVRIVSRVTDGAEREPATSARRRSPEFG